MRWITTFNFADVQPWWFRIFIVAFLSLYLFSSRVFGREHFFEDLGMMTLYGLALWSIIAICAGIEKLFEWLSVAFVMGLTVLILGALMRKTSVVDLLTSMVGGKPSEVDAANRSLIFTFMILVIAWPWAIFVVQSFPVTPLLRWVSMKGANGSTLPVVLAMFLRSMQNVTEIVTRSKLAWQEENPERLLPRFRADWQGSLLSRLAYFRWVQISAMAWISAILVQSLQTVPLMVRDFERLQWSRTRQLGRISQ